MMAGYILMVEDDEDVREALALEMALRGHAVRTAAHGAEALAQMGTELPRLVVTDLEMPVMNGRVMLQKLRASPLGRDVPVLVLSAFGYEWEAELMGAQGYLRKPVTAQRLAEAIDRLIRPVHCPLKHAGTLH